MQERTELVLPASFAAGFDPVQQREAPFQSIIATVTRAPALLHADSACPSAALASVQAAAGLLKRLTCGLLGVQGGDGKPYIRALG